MNISYKKMVYSLAPWVVLAVGMSLLRISLTDSTRYIWMNWNLFLALVPIGFAWLFEKSRKKIFELLWFLVWFFFLPNAVYLVTDFIHMNTSPDLELLWYDGIMLFAYAVVGVVVSGVTLVRVIHKITPRNNTRIGLYGVFAILISFGIYLGRYIRWNTWDIITRPVDLFANIFEVVTTHIHEPVFYLTMIFFTLLSWVSIISYKQLVK